MLSTSGLLGYGFPEASLAAGIARNPQMIGVDGGSTDPGPYYLGSGKTVNSSRAMKRDLQLMLGAALAAKIPLVIGSCGGAGSNPHLDIVAGLVREIARERGLHFRLAVIRAEQDKASVKRRLAEGAIAPLRVSPQLDDATIDRAAHITAMMGPEPYMRALDAGAQVVLAGRSSDPASWAACAMRAGLPPAPSWYAGKFLECGATAAVPKGHDCLFTAVGEDHVVVEATNPIRRCTPSSCANHSLHENASPNIFVEPGGILDATDVRFEAVSDRAVKISGMQWKPMPYTNKLEGAEFVGYRAITICGTRDPLLIARLDDFLESVREATVFKASGIEIAPDEYTLLFRVYGKNGVMGAREPVREIRSHELGILAEVVAPTQEIASAVLALARVSLLHTDFEGRLCREGNMAFPYSPSDIVTEPAYRFSIFHVVTPKDPYEMFPIEYEAV
ncbi:MAG: acyclic terpene utilization AtuA family protein [Candidatus Eremiobacteraeota bacterium]|nr:acyclic terpene utilization AtuA family protein [Candidatus Eremiobacteraeota bacterium]